jgi:hypothetical protein
MEPAHWSISPRTGAAVLLNKQHVKPTWRNQAKWFYADSNGESYKMWPSQRRSGSVSVLFFIFLL